MTQQGPQTSLFLSGGAGGGGGGGYGLVSELWVDIQTAVPPASQDGSTQFPFSNVQAAINRAAALGPANRWHIRVSFGDYSAQVLTVPANIDILIEGPIRRQGTFMAIGPINWTVTGNLTSRLSLRNLTTFGAVTVIDGAPPAVNALLSFENCQLGVTAGGLALQTTGTSFVTCQIAGTGFAAFETLPGETVFSRVTADIDLDQGVIHATNTQFQPSCLLVRTGNLRATGCAFEQDIECTGIVAEFYLCRFFEPPRNITFTGAAGRASFDGLSNFSFLSTDGVVNNGIKDGGILFSAGVAVEPVDPLLLPRFNSLSPFLTFVLGSQTNGNYTGFGNAGLYAVARMSAVGPPVLQPFVALSGFDSGAATFVPGATDSGRILYYGGGGWLTPDANNHQFYTTPLYAEVPDTGRLRVAIVGDCVAIAIGDIDANGTNLVIPGQVTPAPIGVSQNNYTAPFFAIHHTLRITPTAPISITGLDGAGIGVAAQPSPGGRIFFLFNVATDVINTITLTHDDPLSLPINRFLLPGNAPLVIPANGSVLLKYDRISSRWRVVGKATI